MLRVLTSHRHSSLGQVRQAHIGLCSTVNWIGDIPAVGALIREKGCSEAGKSVIRSGLLTAVGPGSPASALITSVGAEFVVDCLCAGSKCPRARWADTQIEDLSILAQPSKDEEDDRKKRTKASIAVVGALAVAGLALAVTFGRRATPEELAG